MKKKVIIGIIIAIVIIGCGVFFYINNLSNKKTDKKESEVTETTTPTPSVDIYTNGNENAIIKCDIDLDKVINKSADKYWFDEDLEKDKMREGFGTYLNINNDKRSVSLVIDFNDFFTVDREGDTSLYGVYTIKGFNRDVVSVFNSGGGNEIFFLLDNGEVYYSEITVNGKMNVSNNIIPIAGKIDGVSGVKKFYLLSASGGTGAWYVVAGAKSDGSYYDLSAKLS